MRKSPVIALPVLTVALALGACRKQKEPEPDTTGTSTTTAAASAASSEKASDTSQQPEAEKGIPAPPDVAAPPADAEATKTGLKSKVIKKGTGDKHPQPQDKVSVHYTGWTTDGKMFDSSLSRGMPTTFGVNQVIKGWTEGLGLMVEGETRRLWIPADLAYGKTPRGGAPAGDLVFDVDLIEIIEGPKPPDVPKDVAAAPAKAKKTASGLAYVALTPGKGKVHPSASSRVKVHYSGWTTDGKMFDSSVMRGEPASFSLGGVIPGWTEGVQLMTEGAKYRFWIPGKLAYGDEPKRPGAPAGTLVFDIELIEIQ